MFYGDDSPIAAVATPPGQGALAVIRTSGKNAIELLAERFSAPRKLTTAAGNTIVYGWILGKDRSRLDETLVSVYRAPKSYTGEDGADISCHGGYAVAKAALETLHDAGFRDALPGEFTFRAFMNGKLDLTRAESVMEIVSAKTDKAHAGAVRRLSGDLETEIRAIKEKLVRVLAGAELFLDYSEDEFAEADADERSGMLPQRELAREALAELRELAASFHIENLYQEGALAVIAGRPNAGKSSLFNRLLKEDRAIVSESPGATRDWLEAWIAVEGIPVRLADTAGIRDSSDAIEKNSVERSIELIKCADVILYIVDGTVGLVDEDKRLLHSEEIAGKPLIMVWNKDDVARDMTDPPAGVERVSAKTGKGVPNLPARIAEALAGRKADAEGGRIGVASARQKALIDKAVEQVVDALDMADKGRALDIIAPSLREAVDCLGEITGEVSTADILEVMFSSFCVGK
ncbi:MAG: tRNA uridine-5-carboxymethylaminomethyl(34) synthesis GTPase MnmE [Treponema sp.]|jgi:tRNA modification GTPase|nr:tRNA uridine-5-carboxymethylaminomethyl(34) synthesis GTPase MnmE [Treponema sp.]